MENSSESAEETWCADQRTRVIEYLARARVVHGEIGESPAWHVWPQVAVWAVESVARPGWVGWWVISGDLPIDYATCGPGRHPREGVRDIAQRWQTAATQWEDGIHDQDWSIGSVENEAALARLLKTRASLLLSWAADDSLWPE